MPALPLITLTRARDALDSQGIALNANETATLERLIDAVSQAIETYCQRVFAERHFDEQYSGTGDHRLVLNHWPVTELVGVWGPPQVVLRLQNTAANTVLAGIRLGQSAPFQLTILDTSGAETIAELDLGSYPTTTTLVAAINAISGWTATAVLANWPSAYLLRPIGRTLARGRELQLSAYTQLLMDYHLDAISGVLYRSSWSVACPPEGSFPDEQRECGGQIWEPGIQNYRVEYTAGFATVPEDVQQAAAEWVATLYWQSKNNPGLAPGHPPLGVRWLLEPYRSRRLN